MQSRADMTSNASVRTISSSDIFVLMSMAGVAGAIAVALVLHGGWSAASAAMVGGLAWVAMVPMHMLARLAKPATPVMRLPDDLDRVDAAPTLAAPTARAERSSAGMGNAASQPTPRSAVRGTPKLPPQYADAIADAVAARDEEAGGTTVSVGSASEAPESASVSDGARARLRALPSTSPQIDDIIKRLASDISAGRQRLEPVAGGEADGALAAAAPAPPVLAGPFPVRAEDFFAPPPLPGAVADDTHVDEIAAPPLATSASSRIAAIADALLSENIEVFLEPIQGLEDTGARHYEVSARLRLDDGNTLGHDEYTAAARGTGLLPLIDAVKVSHTKRVALQLIERGRTGSFFSQVAGESLSSEQFGDDVSAITRRERDVTARLVLSFPQADVRGFVPAQWRALDDLRQLGFQFAIEHLTDMDMDFETLGRRGFTFAKLDADVFVNGLPAPDGVIPPADACQHLARAGLTLVVQAISDERQLMEILGFGVLFGQGDMFGGARPVRAHVLRDAAPVYEGATGTA